MVKYCTRYAGDDFGIGLGRPRALFRDELGAQVKDIEMHAEDVNAFCEYLQLLQHLIETARAAACLAQAAGRRS